MAIKSTCVKLDENTYNDLEKLAINRDRSPHWIMKKAIQEYVTNELLQDEFNKQSAQALEDYLQTGLHSTESEVNDWLSSWGTDSEKDAPECHK